MFHSIMHQAVTCIITVFFAAAALPGEASPAVLPQNEDDVEILPKITSGGAIVIDFETGDEIFAHNADELFPPASMTKMMTVYLVYQAIESGKIGLDTIVPISGSVEEFSQNPDVSNIQLSRAERYTVDELLNITIVVSASGSAIALAELVGGSWQQFIRMMNEQAAEWGIDANFESTFGGGENTLLTARAMAVIARNTIMQFPQVLEKTSMPSFMFGSRKLTNTNRLLGVYDGVDGYKTGTRADYGENFTATAERDGTRIIAVTLSSRSGKRYDDTTVLLDYGFAVMEKRHEEIRLEEQARLEAEKLEEQARLEEQAQLEELARLEEMKLEEERLETQRLEAVRQEDERIAQAARLEEIRLAGEQAEAERKARDNFIAVTVCTALACLITGTAVMYYIKHRRS